MHKINVNGAELAYEETGGDGEPVVLLHAGIADRRMWHAQLTALAPRFRAIAVDLRGYGDSALPPDPFANHDDIAALLDTLGLARAALVGCSFGGAVAIDTALAHPGRVSALALFGTAISGHDWSDTTEEIWRDLIGTAEPADLDAAVAADLRFWVVGPLRRPEEVDPALLTLAAEMDRRALVAERALSAVPVTELDPPAIGRLSELRMPVLVTAGAADLPDITALADRISAEVPGALRLPDVPDAGHLLPLERPAAVNGPLIDFLTTALADR